MMLQLYTRYVLSNTALAMILIASVLVGIIMLVQSLRFLELVMGAGVSTLSFWILMGLSIPRFLENILPLALMLGIAFVYVRFAQERELIIARASGLAPYALAKPALILSVIVALLLSVTTLWLTPLSLSNLQTTRQVIKTQYSALLLRSGVFNALGDGLMIYIRGKSEGGELKGLIIHDKRNPAEPPSTIFAQSGQIISDAQTQRFVVYDGQRQSFNTEKNTLSRLKFEQYNVDLPSDDGTGATRWKEPEERSVIELFNPDLDNIDDRQKRDQFTAELHRRVLVPLLAPLYALIILCFILKSPYDRRSQNRALGGAVASIIVFQGVFLALMNMAYANLWVLIPAYLMVCVPIAFCLNVLVYEDKRKLKRYIVKKKPDEVPA